MRAGLLVIAVILLIGVLALYFVVPQMRAAEAKDAAQSLVSGADSAKQQVAAAAEKSGQLAGSGNGVKVASRNDPKHGEMKWIVSDNGAIRGWNEKNALEVTITPTLQSGKASWACKGYPVDAMPTTCGGRS